MKVFLCTFIMAFLSLKLNAFDGEDRAIIKEAIKSIRTSKALEKGQKPIAEEEFSSDKGCAHCPEHLKLIAQINTVVDKMASDPNSKIENEHIVKINKLKFLYYTQAIRSQDGSITCKRVRDYQFDSKPSEFDGQYKLLAEDVLNFKSISEIQYINPNVEEVVYYYRGVDGNKDIIIQAILSKDGGKLRYFRLTPENEKEKEKEKENKSPDLLPNVMLTNTDLPALPPEHLNENYSLEIDPEVKKKNKYVPNDIQLAKLKINQEVLGGVSISGTSNLSVKRNTANLALKNGSKDLMLVKVVTKATGKTDHQIIIPYAIQVNEAGPKINGVVIKDNNAEMVTMSLTNQSVEYIRGEYRKNTLTNQDSYVLARDFQIAANEYLSVKYTKDEAEKKYTSLRHVKTIKNNATMVLDVALDEDRNVTFYYQVSSKF